MLPTHPPTFVVNHGGIHSRCKNTLKKSDLRIQPYGSLSLVAEPLQIYWHHCQEDFMATTIDVWMYVNLSCKELFYEVPIEEFMSQRERLEDEYRGGLESMRNRNSHAK